MNHFINILEKANELIRIKTPVSPHFEISEVTDRISKNNGPALLFENTGTDFPVLINALGSEKRMCLALGVNNLDEIGKKIEKLLSQLTAPHVNLIDKIKLIPKINEMSHFMPRVKKGRGECQQIIMDEPDITKLPVLTCWTYDGGPFITLPVVHTKDTVSGIRNVGMYRMQVFSKNMTAMHWHLHKGAASHFDKYKALGEKMPVAVTLGGDPVYTYVATAPLPDNFDEYILAGFIRKSPVYLVKCITNDLEVPVDADFVIEGYIDPMEDKILEGPFGDHTGYYSLSDYYPKFHITCITHRKDAVYPATIVGIPPQEDAYIGKATERIFLTPMRLSVAPEIVDIHMPQEGVFHNIAIVSIRKKFSGQALKVMNSLWGAGQMMFNKIMIIVDTDVSVSDYKAVAKAFNDNVNPLNDIMFSKGPLDILDHSANAFAFGSKLGIDASLKNPQEKTFTDKRTKNQEPRHSYINKETILKNYTEIKDINDNLLKEGFPVVFISIDKNRINHVRDLNELLIANSFIKNISLIIYMEHIVDIFDIPNVVWRMSNNIDPKRDCYFSKLPDGNDYPGMAIDGTRKSEQLDGFQRPWPNIIVMDDNTIKKVDAKWNEYGLGNFILSPSLKYKTQVYKGGAIAE